MGGKSNTTTQPTTGTGTTPAPAPGQSNMMTIPGSMPGQLDQIAQQLGAGFGQNPADILAQLQQLHKPMQVQDPSKPWSAGGAAPAPAGPQIINGRPTLSKNGRTYMWSDDGGYTPM